ncbi:heat-inducible transcriptional repressor HrcA [Litorivivens sp.]|uniref:heat-inducible transcriptional repressor HrcA n=1 Tax=Litorivivens sp. TaxID=2020868 RepID=UPI00356977DE
MVADVLNDRAQKLLKVLVERYIREGQPVGSKTLLQDSGLPVSAATVRNIMAELEERGYVVSPHTSAGRMPTQRGYRFFVDSLITVSPLEGRILDNLKSELDAEKPSDELIASASQLLSSLTRQAGLVTLPSRHRLSLRQVEFLPLADNRILVILVVNQREVQNRVIRTERAFTESELKQAANYINQHYAGRDLDTIRDALLTAMRSDKDDIDRYMQASLDLAARALEMDGEGDRPAEYVLAGESQLLDAATPDNLDKMRELFNAFARKKDILDLVDRCLLADGVQIFIGEESGYKAFGDFSVITAPYQLGDGRPLGVLGVIGPTRMAYERVIPMVDVTARMLSLALRAG